MKKAHIGLGELHELRELEIEPLAVLEEAVTWMTSQRRVSCDPWGEQYSLLPMGVIESVPEARRAAVVNLCVDRWSWPTISKQGPRRVEILPTRR